VLNFVLKVVSRCNLDCSYCYVYNKGDSTWRTRPAIMSDEVFAATLDRVRRYCERTGQRKVQLTFHGGEPCLAGPQRFGAWCRAAREALAPIADIELGVQTNGTLLDECWAGVLRTNGVQVGISIDGSKEIHDAFRVDHRGRGSYDHVVRGLAVLRQAEVPFHVLAVIQLGADGLSVHQHLLGLGVTYISYLLPDFTHDTIPSVLRRYGPTPCADFLLPILEDWWAHGTLGVRISIFWHATRLILGAKSGIDILGNRPLQFVFIETDGAIEGLDVLRVCKPGIALTGLNVLTDDFWSILELNDIHRAAIFEGVPLPGACHGCPEATTCAGGYLPHRYSIARGFDNPTVWCADMLKLFTRLRELLDVPVQETALRRRVLQTMAMGSRSSRDNALS
jgi:uncharacterized protein